MERHLIDARPGWQAKIEEQGLIYWKTEMPDGSEISYWNEEAFYSFTTAEVYDMEAAARLIVSEMLVPAGDFIIENDLFARMGIPGWAVPRIKETWESEPPMLYGRFDFAYGPEGLKLLEYNADTPTCLVETAAQWFWMRDKFGEGGDQWNMVHEALVARWKELAPRLPGERLHLLHTMEEHSGEDFMTAGYLAETARQAGLNPKLMAVESLGLTDEGFVDGDDLAVRSAFKLYPWEWMVHEQFCDDAMRRMGDGPGETLWVEPIWKMLWSNKGILPVLWHLFPDHPNLLPAYFEGEGGAFIDVFGAPVADAVRMQIASNFVRKPLLAREGANTTITVAGKVADQGPDQDYGEEGYVVQRYTDLGSHTLEGGHPVLGVWTVDMEPVGLGIRESDSLVTNNLSRFVPHIISD